MIIPEIIIQRVLVNGIRKIRNIPWKSDQLFKSVPQSFAQQFYELVSNTPIDITINYPREDSQFPCIAILLRAEEETDMFLGDLLSAGYDNTDSLFGSEGFFYTKNEGTSTETYGLTDLLGSGNKFEDTPKIFDKSVQTYKELRGSGQSCSYLLQVMTDDQDFTIFLYHMIRYIILSGIPTFTANGMHQMRLSGTDFLPQASQQPNFIFMRGINMNFLYFADYFLKEGDPDLEAVAKAFIINIGDSRDSSPDALAEVQQPHITAVSIITGATGTTVTGIAVSGINFQYGLSIEFIKSTLGSTFDILGSVDGVVASNIVVGSTEHLIEFTPTNAGEETSTTKIFVANSADSVPTNLLEGMFLEVIGPTTHAAYGEKRRIISFTSGSGGTITVVTDFSAGLSSAVVQVIKESSVETVTFVDGDPITEKFTFDLTIAADATPGVWDIKITNPDLISTTLSKSFTIT